MVLRTKEHPRYKSPPEERLAALHRASLELVSNLSFEAVLERIAALAREQAQARTVVLELVDEQGRLARVFPAGTVLPERPGRAETRRGVFAPAAGGRAFLETPILGRENGSARVLGHICLADKEDEIEFSEADAQVIETLAAYAAIAIKNARLYEEQLRRDKELCQRSADLKLINDLATTLATSQDIDLIMTCTLDQVMSNLGFEASEIFLAEEDGHLRLALHRGEAADAFWTRERFTVGDGLVGLAAQTGQIISSDCLSEDARFLRPAVVEAGFECLVSIPLSAFGKIVGVMTVVARHECRLGEREMQLLNAIGAWAGITIENTRLNQQTRRLAVLEERERIGMDLHDGIIQSIYAVGLGLDYARSISDAPDQTRLKIEQAIQGLNSTIRDLRTYILDLRPRQFRGEDLMEGLRRLVDEFHANGLQNVILAGPENGLAGLPIANATALFHIAQESLANIAKHARASQTTVHVWTAPERVLLEIADNGQGFDLHKMSVTLGHGLSNMHTRAHKVGGDVEITSDPGAGTTVLAWVPLRRLHDLHNQSQQSQD